MLGVEELADIEVRRLTKEVRQREEYLREYESKLAATKSELVRAIQAQAELKGGSL